MASGRLAQCTALLRWLEQEGCAHCVRLGETPSAGVGVFATRDIDKGDVIISCPVRCVIGAAETRLVDSDKETVAFSDAMDALRVREEPNDTQTSGSPISDTMRMQLTLLRERHLAETTEQSLGSDYKNEKECNSASTEPRLSGYWAHYVRSLPGDELVESLPLDWSEDDLQRRLAGTSLLREPRKDVAFLERLAKSLDTNQTQFPPEAFNLARLKWEHAVFWSRAIALPQAGWGRGGDSSQKTPRKRTAGDDGALVPLLDMCNHQRNPGTELRCRGSKWQLLATKPFKTNEEIRINYGPKGNGELLRRHGFVIPGNPFDTCPLWVNSGSIDSTPCDSSKRILLHRGIKEWGEFPDGLVESFIEERWGTKHDDITSARASKRVKTSGTRSVESLSVNQLKQIFRDALDCVRRIPSSDDDVNNSETTEQGFESTPGPCADLAAALYRQSQRELLWDWKELAETNRLNSSL